MAIEIWAEKYRPKTLDEYVWRDPAMRKMVEGMIADGALPHLLLSGVSGTGKTSLAFLLLRMLGIPNEDILKIHASRERKIDDLQDKIINFINSWAFNPSGIKYVLMDEADKLSQHAQGLLRTEMEAYSSSCRFLLTCNYPNKIIPALHGRMQEIKFATLGNDEFLMRLIEILDAENVTYDVDVLAKYYEKAYPDLRKTIGLLQQNTLHGVLMEPRADDGATPDYLLNAAELFREGRHIEARKLIIAQADPEDYESMFRWMYENLSLFGKTQDQQDEAVLIIRKALVHDGVVADREINASACFIELSRITQ